MNGKKSLIPYLLLALVVLALQPLLSWYNSYATEKTVTIEYLPEGATSSVIYQVDADGIQRHGECITFIPQNEEEEGSLTLCDRYQEITQK